MDIVYITRVINIRVLYRIKCQYDHSTYRIILWFDMKMCGQNEICTKTNSKMFEKIVQHLSSSQSDTPLQITTNNIQQNCFKEL